VLILINKRTTKISTYNKYFLSQLGKIKHATDSVCGRCKIYSTNVRYGILKYCLLLQGYGEGKDNLMEKYE
jgi:hypothetical protein